MEVGDLKKGVMVMLLIILVVTQGEENIIQSQEVESTSKVDCKFMCTAFCSLRNEKESTWEECMGECYKQCRVK